MSSMNKRILVTLPLTDEHKARMEAVTAGKDAVIFYKPADQVTEEDLCSASAVIGNLPENRLRGHAQLEWVQLNSAGAAQYTEEGILPESCVLTNAAGAYGPAVSEHMLALTFALIRRLGQYVRNQTEHRWQKMGRITSVEGAVIAVLGLGDIGSMYARKVKALGAHVIGFRRTLRDKPEYLDEQYTLDMLDEVLPRADVVAMVLPGLSETAHVMDERRLALMKQGAYLINVGRGNAIDPDALEEALRSGHLGGAGLDVTEPEPLTAESPLWDFDNVIITPHVAGGFFLPATFERVVNISVENLNAYVNGKAFTHVVDRKKGY